MATSAGGTPVVAPPSLVAATKSKTTDIAQPHGVVGLTTPDAKLTTGGPKPVTGSSKKRKRDMVGVQPVKLAKNPFNMTARNFPKQRRHKQSTNSFLARKNKARTTTPREALDAVRAALQPTLNVEIEKVLESYQEMFRMAAYNIADNLKETVTEDHVNFVLRCSLEEAKKMFKLSDEDEETASISVQKPLTPARNVIIKKNKMQLRRDVRKASQEGKQKDNFNYPTWTESHLTASVEIIMGFKAQKILGFASQRGRLYVRHPRLFRYLADNEDKEYLSKRGHLPTNAGKSYLMLADDVRLLATSHPDYKDNLGIKAEDIKGFTIPEYMLKKMRTCMKKQALIQRVRKSIDSP